jgi:hypothetical protein
VPVVGSQPSGPLQASPSSQGSGVPTQTPAEQVSPKVHRLASSHGLVFGVNTQPNTGSQVSLVHELPSSQTSGGPGWHPVTGSHPSVPLQRSPS